MALNGVVVERKLGGGRLYYEGTTVGGWEEFGKVKEFKYKIDSQEVEGISEDNCMEEIDDVFAQSVKAELSFKTENINAENYARAVQGEVVSVNYAVGDTLPNENIAAEAITIEEIKAGQILGKQKIKYVGAKCRGKQFVIEFFAVVLKADGDIAIQSTKDLVNIGFTGKILAKEIDGVGQYFTTHLI